jgi:hypothetical protein
MHTFVWDNVAFDGPFTYRDLSVDAPDANVPTGANGTVNLGKTSAAGRSSTWEVAGMPAAPSAEAVRVLFNFFHYDAPTVLNLTINGRSHVVPWPYPERQGFTWRTMAASIPITDLVPGTNVVTIGANQTAVTSNVAERSCFGRCHCRPLPEGVPPGAAAPAPRPRFGFFGLLPIGLPFASTSV